MNDESISRRVRIVNTSGKAIETKCILDDGSELQNVKKIEISPIEPSDRTEVKITIMGAEIDVVADEVINE